MIARHDSCTNKEGIKSLCLIFREYDYLWSIRGKLDSLQCEIVDKGIDICIVTETWLPSDDTCLSDVPFDG